MHSASVPLYKRRGVNKNNQKEKEKKQIPQLNECARDCLLCKVDTILSDARKCGVSLSAADMIPLPSSVTVPAGGSAVSDDSTAFPVVTTYDDDLSAKLTPSAGAVTDSTVVDTHIVLPDRYQQVLSKRRHQQAVLPSTVSADLRAREEDLGIALAWIRQEMVQMKEQDKCLLKQFIDLRASILQLRCLYHCHGNAAASGTSSLQGSSTSLNEVRRSPRSPHIARADSDMAMAISGFWGTSSSLPNSPQLFRFKWRSDELM